MRHKFLLCATEILQCASALQKNGRITKKRVLQTCLQLCCRELGCKKVNCVRHWIIEFVSCGPKNYTYKLNTGGVVCKVRGFSLNHKASQILNFESMKKALYSWKNQDETELVTIRTEICRDKKVQKFSTELYINIMVLCMTKKVVLETVPYGYRF